LRFSRPTIIIEVPGINRPGASSLTEPIMSENRIAAFLSPGFPGSGPESPPMTIWGVWLTDDRPEGRWLHSTGGADGRVFFLEREEAEKEAEEMRAFGDDKLKLEVVRLRATKG
jgi:hypothetical protein